MAVGFNLRDWDMEVYRRVIVVFLDTNYFFCCKNLEIAKKCSIFASELVYTEIVTQNQYNYGYYRSLFEVRVVLHDFG